MIVHGLVKRDPGRLVAIGLELTHHVSLQPLHYADVCEHCPSDVIADEQERLSQPACGVILVDLFKLENKGARIGSGNELAARGGGTGHRVRATNHGCGCRHSSLSSSVVSLILAG
jgi:hypothetical protein